MPAPLVFVDVSTLPDAFRIVGGTGWKGEAVTVEARLFSGDAREASAAFELVGKVDEPDALADAVVRAAERHLDELR